MITVDKGHVEYEGMYAVIIGEVITLLHDIYYDVLIPHCGGVDGANEEMARIGQIAVKTNEQIEEENEKAHEHFREILGEDGAKVLDTLIDSLVSSDSPEGIQELVDSLKESRPQGDN